MYIHMCMYIYLIRGMSQWHSSVLHHEDAAGATAARASRAAVRTAAKGGNPPAVCCATLPNHKGDPATITAWNVNGLGPRLDNNSGGQLI